MAMEAVRQMRRGGLERCGGLSSSDRPWNISYSRGHKYACAMLEVIDRVRHDPIAGHESRRRLCLDEMQDYTVFYSRMSTVGLESGFAELLCLEGNIRSRNAIDIRERNALHTFACSEFFLPLGVFGGTSFPRPATRDYRYDNPGAARISARCKVNRSMTGRHDIASPLLWDIKDRTFCRPLTPIPRLRSTPQRQPLRSAMSPHTCYRYRYTAKDGKDVLLHGLLTCRGPTGYGNTFWCRDSDMYYSWDWVQKLQLGSRIELYLRVREEGGKWSLENGFSNLLGGFWPHELPKVVGETYKGKVKFTVPAIGRSEEEYIYDVVVTLLEKKDKCDALVNSSDKGIPCKPPLAQTDINAKAKEDEKKDQEKVAKK